MSFRGFEEKFPEILSGLSGRSTNLRVRCNGVSGRLKRVTKRLQEVAGGLKRVFRES